MVLWFAGLILLGIFLYTQNNLLRMTRIDIHSKKLPEAFDGMKIVQLSDLHGKTYGEEQMGLVEKIKKEKPDLIVLTGDMVDKRNYKEEPSLILAKKLTGLAPVYYVTGNHEWWSEKNGKLKENMAKIGVVVLENSWVEMKKQTASISIFGMEDPNSNMGEGIENFGEEHLSEMRRDFSEKTGESDSFKILLSHRPELFEKYKKYGFDLVLSGHTHGGQVRLPFIGGLIAPGQGLFPKYSAGCYESEGTQMVVSAGLGNSIIPQRLFNRPEIVVLTLKK